NSPQLVSETLKENGIDEDALEANATELAGRLLAQMKIKLAKQKKKNLLSIAQNLLQRANIELQNLDPSEKLYNLLKGEQTSASFTFNSLKDFSNDDVLQMLSEIELLELIDELEKKKD